MWGMESEPGWMVVAFWSFLSWFVVFAFLGGYVADKCGRGIREGFLLGGLFGPLGVILVALLPHFPNDQ